MPTDLDLAAPDVPGVTFASIPGHPAYLLGSDRSLWGCRRRGRPSARVLFAPAWRRLSAEDYGRASRRYRVSLWDGSRLVHYRLDDLHARLFGSITLEVAA